MGQDREIDLSGTGMDTLELLARVQRSAVDATTLDALRITVDRLCSDYPSVPAERLLVDGRQWLGRVADLRTGPLTLAQHREVLALAGWLALLVGCVENDLGDQAAAEATRRAALSIGTEVGHGEIQGWAHEMRAWFALTAGNYRGVIGAARAGGQVAGRHSVSAQLAGQEAKAWARLGSRRQVEEALCRGRELLDALPYPDNIAHHFVVDPGKFDFYTMDCYRVLGEDTMAENLAEVVLRTMPGAPMRVAEARVTLGVAAARSGDLEQAVHHGRQAMGGGRRSMPSLALVTRELARVVERLYGADPAAGDYLDEVRDARRSR